MRTGGVSVAYQVVGDGPIDLVYASGWLHNADLIWESPRYRDFLHGLAEFSRLVIFDKRGTGLSDRNVGAPTLEERADDIRAVMDAVGSETANIFGVSEGGSMTCMFAATYPERTSSIVLYGSNPCAAWKPDWPYGDRRGDLEKHIDQIVSTWGETWKFERFSPEMVKHEDEVEVWRRMLINSASPSSAEAISRLNYEIDIRPVLSSISSPALAVVREKDAEEYVEGARLYAKSLQNAQLKFLDGRDHLPWFGDSKSVLDAIRDFVFAEHGKPTEERVLASVLMTDIAASTEHASNVGDARWRELINLHDDACKRSVDRHNGQFVKSTGDGVLAIFPGPSRAIESAVEIRGQAANLGLPVRAGVHSGECLRRGDDVSGLAINIASRIADAASSGDILVSGTVRDLVVGSKLSFEPLGDYKLKGLPGSWPLLKLSL